MRIAVIGSGISGSLAARILAAKHHVHLFEASRYAGGHANTVDVEIEEKQYSVDTGFMVFNRRTYPNFCRLLQLLEITSQASDMSFSVRCDQTGLEYQGSSIDGIFAQRRNLARPAFWRMLSDIVRFNKAGTAAARAGTLDDGKSVGEFLEELGVGPYFLQQYLIPMASAIWSSTPQSILDFPGRFMIGFFHNHGLMQIKHRPQWRTISGGSRCYVQALLEPIQSSVRLGTPVQAVSRSEHAVIVESDTYGREEFDEVVFATHSDQTLAMLTDATDSERSVLGAIPYHANQAILHTDTRLLPQRARAWASWNYHVHGAGTQAASVTYDLSRLQNHDSPTPILLTLNPTQEIDPQRVLRTFLYHHPAYSVEAIDAQRRFSEINGRNHTHFCGAYWGYGFHEDGVNSALAVAENFGLNLESCTVASMKESSATGVVTL